MQGDYDAEMADFFDLMQGQMEPRPLQQQQVNQQLVQQQQQKKPDENPQPESKP